MVDVHWRAELRSSICYQSRFSRLRLCRWACGPRFSDDARGGSAGIRWRCQASVLSDGIGKSSKIWRELIALLYPRSCLEWVSIILIYFVGSLVWGPRGRIIDARVNGFHIFWSQHVRMSASGYPLRFTRTQRMSELWSRFVSRRRLKPCILMRSSTKRS